MLYNDIVCEYARTRLILHGECKRYVNMNLAHTEYFANDS